MSIGTDTLLAAAAAATMTRYQEVRVMKVVDGDTVHVETLDGDEILKVRISGIDAPELKQRWGQESKKAMERFLHYPSSKPSYRVYLERKSKDRYGRTVGKLYVAPREASDRKTDIQYEMLRSGNAWWYSHYDDTPEYEKAFQLAQKEKVGLWASGDDPLPVAPWEYRRMRRMKSAIRKEGFSISSVIAYDIHRGNAPRDVKQKIRDKVTFVLLSQNQDIERICNLYKEFGVRD